MDSFFPWKRISNYEKNRCDYLIKVEQYKLFLSTPTYGVGITSVIDQFMFLDKKVKHKNLL